MTGSRWTLRTLREVVLGWGSYSLSGLWRLLKAIGICYKRGRQYVHSPDPEYIAKRDLARACVEAARDSPEQIVTCYLDEFSFYRQPTVAQDWHARGPTQPLVRHSHRSNRYHRLLPVAMRRSIGASIPVVACTPSATVRCPGHTIQYMCFGYVEYVERVLELAGLSRMENMEEYESWTPYRL